MLFCYRQAQHEPRSWCVLVRRPRVLLKSFPPRHQSIAIGHGTTATTAGMASAMYGFPEPMSDRRILMPAGLKVIGITVVEVTCGAKATGGKFVIYRKERPA